MTTHGQSIESAPWIWWGLHATTFALIIVGAIRAPSAAGLASAAGLFVMQLAPFVWSERKRQHWLMFWIAGLTILWSAITLLGQPEFAWVAFPLFFFQLFLLEIPIGVIAVTATTLVVVTSLGTDGLGAPEVIGPVIGAGVAIGAVGAYRALSAENQRNRQLVADLVEARDRLAAAERSRGELEERRRLAREVHDTIAQGLSSILLLTRAESMAPSGGERVTRIGEIAQENLNEARRIVSALSPTGLDESTLAQQIERATNLVAATGDTEYEVETSGESGEVDAESAFALLRVAQGAFANVAAHSEARHVKVELEFEEDTVTLAVTDDGIGFDDEIIGRNHDGSGFGFGVMQDRMDAINGTLSIESRPGHGSAVVARAPRVVR